MVDMGHYVGPTHLARIINERTNQTAMAKRSRTFKQFLLRVHPDRFRALPEIHAENLASVQLLNQFMDEQSGSRAGYGHRRQTVNTPCQTI